MLASCSAVEALLSSENTFPGCLKPHRSVLWNINYLHLAKRDCVSFCTQVSAYTCLYPLHTYISLHQIKSRDLILFFIRQIETLKISEITGKKNPATGMDSSSISWYLHAYLVKRHLWFCLTIGFMTHSIRNIYMYPLQPGAAAKAPRAPWSVLGPSPHTTLQGKALCFQVSPSCFPTGRTVNPSGQAFAPRGEQQGHACVEASCTCKKHHIINTQLAPS